VPAGPPDEGGAAPKKGIPIWIIIGGGLVVAYIIYRSRQNAAAQSSIYPGMGVTTTGTDTGVNPVGGTAVVPKTMADWIAAAEAWARGNNFGAGLASQALYNYTHGLTLTAAQKNFIEKVIAGTGYPPDLLPIKSAPDTNPTSPKGPYFHANLWQWFGLQKGENYLGEPKTVTAAQGKGLFALLGKVGLGNILLPQSNAPIYALLPGGLLPNAKGYNPNATGVWRRIDASSAYALLPKGTQVATLQGWQ
jgi:hypothetical protein